MENSVKLQSDETMQTKVCKSCGKELTIDKFRIYKKTGKSSNTCIECITNRFRKTIELKKQHNDGSNPDLIKFTSRKLIAELRARGYKGELKYVQTIIV